MTTSTIPVSENAIIDILKNIPENMLADIFWKAYVASDNSPLTESEKNSVANAKKDFKKKETVKWISK